MNESQLAGGCLCVAVHYEATGDVTNLCVCHCATCRRAFGAPMVPWGTFSRARFTIVRGRVAEYRSSPDVIHGFCANCGTSITYCQEGRADEIDVAVATLDDAKLLAPEKHIWVRDKLPWVTFGDGLPQFDTVRSRA